MDGGTYGILKGELEKFESFAKSRYNLTLSVNSAHLIQATMAVIAENRDKESRFRSWLDLVQDDMLPMLEFSEEQVNFLNGTSVEKAVDEVKEMIDLVYESAGNFTLCKSDYKEKTCGAITEAGTLLGK